MIIRFDCADQCIDTNGIGTSLPSFQDYPGHDIDQITRYHQAIVPSYRFTCCGEITAWRVDVEPDKKGDNRRYTLNLQVWRPSSTEDQMDNGEYSLVGNNRFTSVSLSGGVAESLLPSRSDYIRFQSRDVLGFYIEDANKDGNGVAVLTKSSYTSELVWYASATSQNVGCPISVGSSGNLNTMLTGAPVISISTGIKQISCIRICIHYLESCCSYI